MSDLTDPAIDREIRKLRQRIAKLQRVCALREEVVRPQRQSLSGTAHAQSLGVIVQLVCDSSKLSLDILMGRSRQPAICRPRMLAYYLARELVDIPYMTIGKFFGLDHATIIHGCQSVQNSVSTEPEYAARVAELKAQCAEKLKEIKP